MTTNLKNSTVPKAPLETKPSVENAVSEMSSPKTAKGDPALQTENPAATGPAAESAEDKKARRAEQQKTKHIAACTAIAQRYAGYYPICHEFHITSDKMVFLDRDKAEALAHQNQLCDGEVTTIKIK